MSSKVFSPGPWVSRKIAQKRVDGGPGLLSVLITLIPILLSAFW